ncbi:MAG: hypothetical protein V3S55_15165 [Nitrospiraceae bacterium]
MLITEIVVSRSCRVNLGNYEGTEHFISMKATIDELDTAEAVARHDLARTVERAMVTQLLRSYKVRGVKAMDTAKKVAKHHGLSYVPKED